LWPPGDGGWNAGSHTTSFSTSQLPEFRFSSVDYLSSFAKVLDPPLSEASLPQDPTVDQAPVCTPIAVASEFHEEGRNAQAKRNTIATQQTTSTLLIPPALKPRVSSMYAPVQTAPLVLSNPVPRTSSKFYPSAAEPHSQISASPEPRSSLTPPSVASGSAPPSESTPAAPGRAVTPPPRAKCLNPNLRGHRPSPLRSVTSSGASHRESQLRRRNYSTIAEESGKDGTSTAGSDHSVVPGDSVSLRASRVHKLPGKRFSAGRAPHKLPLTKRFSKALSSYVILKDPNTVKPKKLSPSASPLASSGSSQLVPGSTNNLVVSQLERTQWNELKRVLHRSAATPELMHRLSSQNMKLVMSKQELHELAPDLSKKHGANVHRALGIHVLDEANEILQVDLGTFLPLVNLLTPNMPLSTINRLTKVQILYNILDRKQSEAISLSDLKEILMQALTANQLYLPDVDFEQVALHVLAKLDVDQDGVISSQDFTLATRNWNFSKIGLPLFPTEHPIQGNQDIDISNQDYLPMEYQSGSLLSVTKQGNRGTTVLSASAWLMSHTRPSSKIITPDPTTPVDTESCPPPKSPRQQQPMFPTSQDGFTEYGLAHRIKTYFQLEGSKFICVALFCILCFAFFMVNFITFGLNPAIHERFGYAVGIAKGCANVIFFTLGLQFVLVCRTLLTALRDIRWCHWIPINKNIVWHRYSGMLFVVASVVHTVCHVVVTFPVLASSKEARALINLPPMSLEALMFTSLPAWTGWGILIISLIMLFTSLARVRNKQYEAFFYTHHLFILLMILLYMHGAAAYLGPPAAWKYLTVPFSMYAIERLARGWRAIQPVPVREVAIQDDTLLLILEKPSFLGKYSPGQFVFLNIPEISKFQWHPFSLTSNHEDSFISLRIKLAGDWTSALFDLARPHSSGTLSRKSSSSILSSKRIPFLVQVDGVFGAPSQDFFDHDHVIFIATGVGATPFLSILKQIESGLNHNESHPNRSCHCPVRADFYWLNRNQKGFKWMSQAIRSVDPKVHRILRVHTFLTCAKGHEEISSWLLWWGLQMIRKKNGYDALTGMEHSSVYWSRPHWETIFRQTASKFPGKKIGVFFCGPKALSKEIYNLIRVMNATSPAFFEYAKENF
jgi:predicted ferric reductase